MHQGLARRAAAHVRRIPILLLLPVVGFGVWVTVDPPYPNVTPIRSDGLFYYSWTDAILDGDFDFCQWMPKEIVAITSLDPHHPNRCLNYPPGLAVLRFPVMAPIALLSGHGNRRTLVVSNANEQADLWLGIATLVLAAWLMWATLRRLDVGTWTAQVTVLCLVFGTGLFDYATFDSSFTHDTSAALFAALIFTGVGAMRRGGSPNPWLVFGLALFIAWIRLPNILPLSILVAAWAIWKTRQLARAERLRSAARLALPAACGVACVLVIQLLYVHWASGVWTVNSYSRGETLVLGRLEEWNVLFSYNHGLFLWYPVLGLMLVVAIWQRKSRNWGWIALASVAALTVVYGSWRSWFLGGGMGQRGFIDIVPIISVAGGVGLSQIRVRGRVLALTLAAVLSWATVELMWGYWNFVLPEDNDKATQYWEQVVGAHALLNDSPAVPG